jgi:hypothetical protein
MRALTYVAVTLVALNGLAVMGASLALFGRLRVLSELASASSRSGVLAAARASDGQVVATSILVLLTLLLAYVASGVWIYNAACNVRALGARGLQNSPGWAVGWYAVPIASLFKPFQAMEEIYKASLAPLGWARQRMPLVLPLWWGAWLLTGFSGYIGLVVERGVVGAGGLSTATGAQLVEHGFDLMAIGLFITIIVRVFRAQLRAREAATDLAEVFA